MQKTLFFILFLSLSACKKDGNESITPETETYTIDHKCTDRPMSIGLHTANYTDGEMDTVIVRRYVGDGNFSQLTDTTIVTLAPDTGQYAKGYFAIVQGNVYGDSSDYEIVIPGAGQTYRIWNIKAVNAVRTVIYTVGQSQGHYECSEPVAEFDISGGNHTKEISYPANGFTYFVILTY